MRKILTIVCMAVMMSSCIKDDKGCQGVMPSQEEAQIKAYASTNGMTVSKHSSGLFYEILNPGSGVTPGANSTVIVTYTGSFLDGKVFNNTNGTPATFKMSDGLIEGWVVGLQLIKKGGHIRLIVPSAMAYGCIGRLPTIAPDTILVFDINLIDVQ